MHRVWRLVSELAIIRSHDRVATDSCARCAGHRTASRRRRNRRVRRLPRRTTGRCARCDPGTSSPAGARHAAGDAARPSGLGRRAHVARDRLDAAGRPRWHAPVRRRCPSDRTRTAEALGDARDGAVRVRPPHRGTTGRRRGDRLRAAVGRGLRRPSRRRPRRAQPFRIHRGSGCNGACPIRRGRHIVLCVDVDRALRTRTRWARGTGACADGARPLDPRAPRQPDPAHSGRRVRIRCLAVATDGRTSRPAAVRSRRQRVDRDGHPTLCHGGPPMAHRTGRHRSLAVRRQRRRADLARAGRRDGRGGGPGCLRRSHRRVDHEPGHRPLGRRKDHRALAGRRHPWCVDHRDARGSNRFAGTGEGADPRRHGLVAGGSRDPRLRRRDRRCRPVVQRDRPSLQSLAEPRADRGCARESSPPDRPPRHASSTRSTCRHRAASRCPGCRPSHRRARRCSRGSVPVAST